MEELKLFVANFESIIGYIALIIIMFIIFYPVISATPISGEYIDSLKSSYKIKSCTWEYDSDTKYVSIKYSYEYTLYKSTYSYDDTMSLKYEDKTLSDYSNTYTKSKK